MDRVKVGNEEQRLNEGREAEGRASKETLDRVELESIQIELSSGQDLLRGLHLFMPLVCNSVLKM